MPENSDSQEDFKVDSKELSAIAELRPRIDGNHTYQSSLIPLRALEDEGEDDLPVPGKRFRLLVVWTEGFGCRVFADLSCITETYLTGTTVVLDIAFDNDEHLELNEEQAIALAKWVSHVAYDFAALSLRQLSANNPITKEIDLPIGPLEPEIDVLIGTGNQAK